MLVAGIWNILAFQWRSCTPQHIIDAHHHHYYHHQRQASTAVAGDQLVMVMLDLRMAVGGLGYLLSGTRRNPQVFPRTLPDK